MRRRTLLVVLAGLAVVLLAARALSLRSHPDRVTRANYDRLRTGMTRAEVHDLLGPPGDRRTGPTETPLPGPPWKFYMAPWAEENYSWPVPVTMEQWLTDSAVIHVAYRRSGGGTDGVEYAEYGSYAGPAPGLVERLLWRIKRQWHRWFPE
jgi:hypothetical protein